MVMNKTANGARCPGCGMPIVVAHHMDGRDWCSEDCALRDRELGRLHESLDSAHLVLAESLSGALDVREKNTGMHSKRVACNTLLLARQVSEDEEWLHQVYWGALLHDIGKIGVPDNILLKAGSLTTKEWEIMHRHPEMGRKILSDIPAMAKATDIVFSHQERYDGTGYPRRLAGDKIPFGARLFAIVDTLDAITSDRPYRRALSFALAKEEIISAVGTQFDPSAVEIFVSQESELQEIVRLKCVKPGFYSKGGKS